MSDQPHGTDSNDESVESDTPTEPVPAESEGEESDGGESPPEDH